jgi:hypothetical protein
VRDRRGWHRRCSPQQLTEVWPTNLGSFRPGDLLDVELGLYLLEDVTPSRTAADVWPLLGGYPYSEVFGDVRTDEQRLRVLRARHYLWGMRRRHAWSEALADYLRVPQHLRGYDIDGPGFVPRRREPSRAARRFEIFEELLSTAPRFATRSIPIAEEGEYTFRVQDRTQSVVFDEELLTDTLPRAHALDAPSAGAIEHGLRRLEGETVRFLASRRREAGERQPAGVPGVSDERVEHVAVGPLGILAVHEHIETCSKGALFGICMHGHGTFG